MSSNTPLLGNNRSEGGNKQKDDHPIFLRVCHAPWVQIGQSSLTMARGIIAGYMVATFIVTMHYDIHHTDMGWMIPFQLDNLSYFMQTLYQCLAFSWTFMHLYHPHASSDDSTMGTVRQMFSPPREQNEVNRTFFSIFYTAANVFPHVVTVLFWMILVPHNATGIPGNAPDVPEHAPDTVDDLLDGSMKIFAIINFHGINSIISLIEVFMFSSVRRMTPAGFHSAGLTAMTLAWVGWAYLGKLFTGKYVYYWLDIDTVGGEYTTTAIIALLGVVHGFFGFTYGLTGLREAAAKKAEDKSYGYNRLPQ